MRSRFAKWKRRCVWAVSILAALAGIFLCLVFTRFNFPHHNVPQLARLQRGDQANLNLGEIRPEIIGHRGSGIQSIDGKELIGNTSQGIQNAISHADWIEIDLRLSRDNQLVVFHDQSIEKKTDKPLWLMN